MALDTTDGFTQDRFAPVREMFAANVTSGQDVGASFCATLEGEVVETEPSVKGQTASSSYKPAVLSNGVRTMVPPYIAVGTKIVILTEDGSYQERAKD